MIINITSIVEGLDFQNSESQSFLDLESSKVIFVTDEEVRAVENNHDISNYADWYKQAIAKAKECLVNQNRYIELPSTYQLNEYRIMESFIDTIPIEEQRDELLNLIHGKGAFSRFRQGIQRFLLEDKWYAFKRLEITKFAQEWCQENGIEYENDANQ